MGHYFALGFTCTGTSHYLPGGVLVTPRIDSTLWTTASNEAETSVDSDVCCISATTPVADLWTSSVSTTCQHLFEQ